MADAVSSQAGRFAGWKLVLVGLTAGILGGGLGVGGGIILVPLLLAVGLDRHRAHATSLAGIVLIAVAGASSFAVSGEIDVAVGLTIGIGGIVGSVVGATVMNKMSARGLTMVFALVLVAAGLRMALGGNPAPGSVDLVPIAETLVALGIGVVGGVFAGLAGIGGGAVNVPATIFLLGLAQHEAQGTSLLAIVLTATAGTLTNHRNGRLIVVEGLLVGLGGAAGSVLGSRIALGTADKVLSTLFGVLALFVGIRAAVRLYRTREKPSPA